MRIDSDRVSVRNLVMERWGARLGLIALWIGGGTLAYAYRPASSCWTPMVLLALTSVVLGVQRGRSLAGGQRRGSRGGLWTDGERVHIAVHGRRHELARGDLVSGWIEPSDVRGVETLVLVTGDEREARMVLPQGTSGAAVLRAVGVGPEQRAVKISVQPAGTAAARASWIFVGTLVTATAFLLTLATAVVALSASLGSALFCAVPAALFGALAWRINQQIFTTTTVIVGTDGIVVERLWLHRIVPRADLDDVIVDGGTVVLQRKGGEQIVVRSSPAGALALADRIAAALEVRAGDACDTLERLDRRGRSAAAWLDDLRALSQDPRGYREATVARQDLCSLVQDGAAPVERRIAAAAALSARPDEEGRAALRVAADTCADARLGQKLRVAADRQLAEGDLEEASLLDVEARRRTRAAPGR